MIHTLLQFDRPFFVPDVETTGLNPAKDRIVELAFQQYDATGLVKEWRSLIDPGAEIPEAVSKIHGITMDRIKACQRCVKPKGFCYCPEGFRRAPTFAEIASAIAHGFSNCDFGGSNVRFDLQFIAEEMERAGVKWNYADACVIDTHRIEQLVEPRNLGALYQRYTGKKLENAHSALVDVGASVAVLVAQFQKYPNLVRELRKLHEEQWGKGQLDPEGKFRMVDGVPCFTQWGKYKNQPMQNADVGYWKFILTGDFSRDVKALAREALAGRFPGDRQ